MTNQYRFTKPPKGLGRPAIQLDNFSLVPANLLGNMRDYRALCDRQPKGTAILVLPTAASPLRRVYAAVARVPRENGKHVRVYAATSSSLFFAGIGFLRAPALARAGTTDSLVVLGAALLGLLPAPLANLLPVLSDFTFHPPPLPPAAAKPHPMRPARRPQPTGRQPGDAVLHEHQVGLLAGIRAPAVPHPLGKTPPHLGLAVVLRERRVGEHLVEVAQLAVADMLGGGGREREG